MAVNLSLIHRSENRPNSDILNQEFSFSGSVTSFHSAVSFDFASTALPVLPDLPETLPDVVPSQPDPSEPDPSSPNRRPFTPPPWVAPGEEPGPKA